MRAMGVDLFCTNQTRVSMGPRLAPFVERYKIRAAFHTHAAVTDPNEVASPESLAKLMAMSPNFMVNLDIGHFTAANYDPVAYMREHHADITNLHIKDRRSNQGPNTPWGTGDTKIREVLALLKREKWPIRAHIEYEYQGTAGAVEEVKKCLDYAKAALA